MSLRGVVPPLVTPFRSDGTLDIAAFEANLEALAAHELAGFLVLGSNGEAASLDEEEKLALVAAARRRVPGRFLLVGTGMESSRFRRSRMGRLGPRRSRRAPAPAARAASAPSRSVA